MNQSLCRLLAISLLAGLAAPAFADCASDIKQVEPQVSEIGDSARKDKAQGAISRALESAQNGDEKGCARLLGEAKRSARLK